MIDKKVNGGKMGKGEGMKEAKTESRDSGVGTPLSKIHFGNALEQL